VIWTFPAHLALVQWSVARTLAPVARVTPEMDTDGFGGVVVVVVVAAGTVVVVVVDVVVVDVVAVVTGIVVVEDVSPIAEGEDVPSPLFPVHVFDVAFPLPSK